MDLLPHQMICIDARLRIKKYPRIENDLCSLDKKHNTSLETKNMNDEEKS